MIFFIITISHVVSESQRTKLRLLRVTCFVACYLHIVKSNSRLLVCQKSVKAMMEWSGSEYVHHVDRCEL